MYYSSIYRNNSIIKWQKCVVFVAFSKDCTKNKVKII